MKKFMCLLCVCMLLFSSVASADQVYAAETGSRQTAAVKKIDLKCGTATTVQVKAKKNQEIEWSILNWLHPKTRERITIVVDNITLSFLERFFK